MLHITKKTLLDYQACADGLARWESALGYKPKYEEPIRFSIGVQPATLDDAIWSLGCFDDIKLVALVAVSIAERALMVVERDQVAVPFLRIALKQIHQAVYGELDQDILGGLSRSLRGAAKIYMDENRHELSAACFMLRAITRLMRVSYSTEAAYLLYSVHSQAESVYCRSATQGRPLGENWDYAWEKACENAASANVEIIRHIADLYE